MMNVSIYVLEVELQHFEIGIGIDIGIGIWCDEGKTVSSSAKDVTSFLEILYFLL